MLIDDEIRKCVAFVGCTTTAGFKLAGTVFFVGVSIEEGNLAIYAVTAKHVVVSASEESTNGKIILRVNTHQGKPKRIDTALADWTFHSDAYADVAVCPFFDHQGLDVMAIGTISFAGEVIIQQERIGIGEDIFLVGLFTEHSGQKKNIPIVRVGNIAAMPEEQIEAKIGRDFVGIDAYLVECRSISGLSGSPVFVRVPTLGRMPIRSISEVEPDHARGVTYLLGIMHGHWELRPPRKSQKLSKISGEPLNIGIAIVIPAQKILEVLDQSELVEGRKKLLGQIKRQRAPKLD
jgi:hypothetical protein